MQYVRQIQGFFAGYDWMLTIVLFILSLFGLAAIYSVDLSRGTELLYFPTQAVAIGIGFIFFLVSSHIHKVRYESASRIIYIVGLLLLTLVLFFGVTIRGTTGWFRFFGFSFQPAEFAKASLILMLGWWISRQGRRFDAWEFVVSSGLATGLYVGLILLQPDLGSSLVLVGIWFGLVLMAGTKKRYIVMTVLAAVVIAVVGWFFLFEQYQKERVLTFLNPELDPLGSGYNVTQSIIAIGSGQFFGRGLGFGSQSQLHFLPEAQTDFIVSVIGEELGFVGLFSLLVLYLILLLRLLRLAKMAKDDFSAYTIMGVLLFLFVQIMVNIGGATGVLPVTGVPLPFVSYGGSSLIMGYSVLGMVQSLGRSSHKR
ncbi:MAG: rod shape-determining protein RodA [Candidatus Magasanikbacteria bacterium CG10_big_fil_rev_8_21_14_0_10_47_10]|uniref:Rod shape-determining protein RodA n=1 Tax=Candidatus Magasanikbacteria bacterium CG10_big_fil_rev_8_21_14_0_10_47_10 TaxID=1974652 RepID=A0A2H0TSA1_9BACT|nr:MAG: rod shape-determining protein RodA [Candidatus Magasanikbacteria bacterium CG10_big_fil_rev_8_21_14_0_10_47_10]